VYDSPIEGKLVGSTFQFVILIIATDVFSSFSLPGGIFKKKCTILPDDVQGGLFIYEAAFSGRFL